MHYPQRLSTDLKYLSSFYNWNDDDKKEVRAAFTDCPEMVQYFIALAAAHRAGYEQHAGNGHVRLDTWCLDRGIESPYSSCFDVKELDNI